MRGKRNEPAFIAHIAVKVSELVDVPLEDVIAQTDDNARRLFSL
jgi:TatD DNase family protein